MEMVVQKNVIPAVQLGRERDNKIVQLISEAGPFTRDQIQQLVFPSHKWPQKCRERLNKLVQRKRIKRIHFGNEHGYVYYTGAWNQKSEHALMVNWVYTSLLVQMKSWFKLHAFVREYPMKYGKSKLIADAFIVLKNTETGKFKIVFVEADKDLSRGFDKVKPYTDLFNSNAWVSQWWAKPDAEGVYQFPKVLVVTTRPQAVKKVIEKQNKKGLRFSICTIVEVKNEVFRYL